MLTDSQFYMWRTIFSLAHADDVVMPEEKRFMTETLSTLQLSLEQKDALERDMHIPEDSEGLFKLITDRQDQRDFFDLARNLVMADGEYHQSERTIMAQLQKMQIEASGVDQIISHTGLELEDDKTPPVQKKKGLFSFLTGR